MTPPSRTRRTLHGVLVALAVTASVFGAGGASAADEDPNLDQIIDPDMPVVTGERVLDAGHVDMGPTFVDGQWRFLIHDDVAKADAAASSVWRSPEQTVFHVVDDARLTVPGDPAYGFVGAEPGSDVWVVPQTQDPDVVWLGWNTQDPEVMQTIDRGITLSLTGVQGPGVVTTYLQSGSFGEPQVLFDSRVTEPQRAWVDVNTHTHANWVFTEPGVYLLRVQADADLVDGTSVSDSQLIRFAVGTATAPADALAATWDGTDAAASPSETTGPSVTDGPVAGDAPATESADPLVAILIGAIGLVAAALIAATVVAIVRSNRARRAALTAHRDAATPSAGGPADTDATEDDR